MSERLFVVFLIVPEVLGNYLCKRKDRVPVMLEQSEASKNAGLSMRWRITIARVIFKKKPAQCEQQWQSSLIAIHASKHSALLRATKYRQFHQRFKRKRFSTFHFDNAVFSQPAGRDFATLPATYYCRRYRRFKRKRFHLSPFRFHL